MGTYFNPGNESFRQAIGSAIYVDKTELLEKLNQLIGTEQKCIALSHARRFGKSQAAGMIDAYYSLGSDSRELFAGFEIAGKDDFEKYLNKYNVIHLDISSFEDYEKENLVGKVWEIVYSEMKDCYPDIMDMNNPVGTILMQVYQKSGKSFVIIIDEWDCVVRNQSDRPDLVHQYLQFLHSLFKSEESKKFLALGYITGILPIKKIEDESALNNFREYTMIESDELTPYFGFTENEVQELCAKYDMDFETMKEWYNGYKISGKNMYNPNSVCEAIHRRRMDSYWKNTSSFSTLSRFIRMDFDEIREDVLHMLGRGRVEVDPETFQNDLSQIGSKDDAFTALIHLGYLGYDSEAGEAYIPNYEVSKAYQSALKESGWSDVAATIKRCNELLKATIRKDVGKVADILEQAHSAYTSIQEYNDENSLSCAITMAYFTAPAYYTVIRELPSGKGFADIAMIPRADSSNKPAMIIELKYNKDADTAIRQIKDRKYQGALANYSGEILLVGINYDRDKDKHHECVIESVVM